jgi:hypothetical protein
VLKYDVEMLHWGIEDGHSATRRNESDEIMPETVGLCDIILAFGHTIRLVKNGPSVTSAIFGRTKSVCVGKNKRLCCEKIENLRLRQHLCLIKE